MDYVDILKSDYYKETYSKIEELKKDFYVNHGFIHIDGVIKNADYLADLFCLTRKQKELLLIASALHDVGYLMGREDHFRVRRHSERAGQYGQNVRLQLISRRYCQF